LPIAETQPVNPASPYAASKVAGEVYLNMFRELYQTSVPACRPATASCTPWWPGPADAPDAPSYAPARLGDLAASALDPRRARDELGWGPTVDVTEGIARTVSYFRTTMRGEP